MRHRARLSPGLSPRSRAAGGATSCSLFLSCRPLTRATDPPRHRPARQHPGSLPPCSAQGHRHPAGCGTTSYPPTVLTRRLRRRRLGCRLREDRAVGVLGSARGACTPTTDDLFETRECLWPAAGSPTTALISSRSRAVSRAILCRPRPSGPANRSLERRQISPLRYDP
jgi:hypothetical protein